MQKFFVFHRAQRGGDRFITQALESDHRFTGEIHEAPRDFDSFIVLNTDDVTFAEVPLHGVHADGQQTPALLQDGPFRAGIDDEHTPRPGGEAQPAFTARHRVAMRLNHCMTTRLTK